MLQIGLKVLYRLTQDLCSHGEPNRDDCYKVGKTRSD